RIMIPQRAMAHLKNVLRLVDWSLEGASRHSDLAVAAMVIASLSMILVPLPTFALDLLLALNIAISISLLMIAMYVSSPVKLAIFPTVLLLSTLLRLSLNIASARLILLQANAGDIIRSFGSFVVRGDVFVGGILFLVITVVQYLVIAKGAERVAEVAARF